MISKAEMDIAEDILRIHELRNRDKKARGHCLSVEWRYKNNSSIVKLEAVSTDWLRYKPEVFDMVDDVLHTLAENNRESLNVIQIEYGYISKYYKKPSTPALCKNRRRRYNDTSWAYKVEKALNDFWILMQKHNKFIHYFIK